MKKYTVDLHNHTPLIFTDYRGSLDTTPRDIVETALERGIDVLGVTDHFAVDYYRKIAEAAEHVHEETGRKLLAVPGSEMKVTFERDEVHVVALLPPDGEAEERFEELLSYLGVTKQQRDLERLQHFSVEFDPARVIQKVRALGGMCHLGHVDRSFGAYRTMDHAILDRLVWEVPVSAIEVVDAENIEVIRPRVGDTFFIQSSDSHSTAEMGRRTSEIQMRDLSFEALRDTLVPVGLKKTLC